MAAPLFDDGGGEAVDAVCGRNRGDEVVGHEIGEALRRLLTEHEDRSVDPGTAQDDPFTDQGDAQADGTSRQRGTTDLDRTVPIAIGLDHGPHLGRFGGDSQLTDVVGDGVEIDLGPRPAR